MGKVVCIDSNVAIWGIKKQSSSGQSYMVEKTTKFIGKLEDEGYEILIPSVVLAEILPVESPENRIEILRKIQSNFRIGNFNSYTAKIFAELFGNDYKAQKEFSIENRINYNKLKIDYMIIATAIENMCNCIITNNIKDFAQFSQSRIKLIEVQEVAFQTRLDF